MEMADSNLTIAREAYISFTFSTGDERDRAAERLAEAFNSLDAHLSKHGNLPSDWDPNPDRDA